MLRSVGPFPNDLIELNFKDLHNCTEEKSIPFFEPVLLLSVYRGLSIDHCSLDYTNTLRKTMTIKVLHGQLACSKTKHGLDRGIHHIDLFLYSFAKTLINTSSFLGNPNGYRIKTTMLKGKAWVINRTM